jgi:hypothetical protein
MPQRRRVEKANPASSLREERRRDPARRAAYAQQEASQRVSRFDTRLAGEADRSGMDARFIAQVLGQVLGTKRNSAPIAARAYARSNRPRGEARIIREA